MNENYNYNEPKILLERFNNRCNDAFSFIYKKYKKEISIYAASLYNWSNEDFEDIVEDAFINMWMSNNKFESPAHIRSYMYVSIRNMFIKDINHNKHIRKHHEYLAGNENSFIADVVECKVYSLVDESLKVLPQMYADVIRMYIEGWKSGEIADSIGRTEQNIYNIKHEAIKILRKKISKDIFLIINGLLC